jgi:hypothetical protein
MGFIDNRRDGTKNLEREKGKWYYNKGKGKMASRRGKKVPAISVILGDLKMFIFFKEKRHS